MKPSFQCFELIRSKQGCRLEAYFDAGQIWLIGWGFSRYFDGSTVKQHDKITQAKADYYLQHEVMFYFWQFWHF